MKSLTASHSDEQEHQQSHSRSIVQISLQLSKHAALARARSFHCTHDQSRTRGIQEPICKREVWYPRYLRRLRLPIAENMKNYQKAVQTAYFKSSRLWFETSMDFVAKWDEQRDCKWRPKLREITG